jgi:N-acetylglucosamine kinase-like BadF-type ATPase
MSEPGVLLLGIDGGGTSTAAWLGAPDGRIIGRALAGPSNAKAVGVAAARSALVEAIASAFLAAGLTPRPADVACLGLAGFDRPDDRLLLTSWSEDAGWARRLILVNDGDLVVAAGTPEGWGIGVIAGTGSIAVGRTADGRTARAGGWGHLIGDEGSGYAVALAALRQVVRRADGRDPQSPGAGPDPLTQQLCGALGVASPTQIISVLHSPTFDRASIAALAPAVVAASVIDPRIEAQILRPAGEALAEMALAVARALAWERGPLPLALAGGFLLATPALSSALIQAVAAKGYEVCPSTVPDPVLGALRIAARAALPT